MYEGIKKNIINGFFNPLFRYTMGCNKHAIFDKMNDISMFRLEHLKAVSDTTDVIRMHLGDGIFLDFVINWEIRVPVNSTESSYLLKSIE